jgi:hypothetical protein
VSGGFCLCGCMGLGSFGCGLVGCGGVLVVVLIIGERKVILGMGI